MIKNLPIHRLLQTTAKRLALATIIAGLGGINAEAQKQTEQLTEAQLHQKVAPACFEVLVGGQLAGSGWFSDESGWAFTALHVVKNRRHPIVIQQGKTRWPATLQAHDAAHDLALLKVEGDHPAGLTTEVVFPEVGSVVYLHGAPLFRHNIWLSGKVASAAPAYEYLGSEDAAIRCFHVMAPAPRGVSGGPWMNEHGRVVGIQSGTMTLGHAQQGLAFVPPGDAISNLLKTKQNRAVATLGSAFEELSEQSPQWLAKLPKDQHGVVIKVLKEDGPLGKAGLSNNTIITHLNGQPLHSRNDAYALTHKLAITKEARVTILHQGKARVIKVTPSPAYALK